MQTGNDEDNEISTHTPHTGCDGDSFKDAEKDVKFQLTHPTRGATM